MLAVLSIGCFGLGRGWKLDGPGRKHKDGSHFNVFFAYFVTFFARRVGPRSAQRKQRRAQAVDPQTRGQMHNCRDSRLGCDHIRQTGALLCWVDLGQRSGLQSANGIQAQMKCQPLGQGSGDRFTRFRPFVQRDQRHPGLVHPGGKFCCAIRRTTLGHGKKLPASV